jgi:hypothetical protein
MFFTYTNTRSASEVSATLEAVGTCGRRVWAPLKTCAENVMRGFTRASLDSDTSLPAPCQAL